MTSVVVALNSLIAILRPTLFVVGVATAVFCTLAWAVRTRRINSFSPLARFARARIDPLILPIEKRIVRAGGMPHSAPWWFLATVVVGSIVLIAILRALVRQLAFLAMGASAGPGGIVTVLLFWSISVLQLAIVVRVLSSWIGGSPYAWWLRWAYVLTEPLLRPLRSVIPMFGMFDITPLVLWFLLSLLRGMLF